VAKQDGLFAYEERYQILHTAGAMYWNDPRPNVHISELSKSLPPHAECIEFGCGEGDQARILGFMGFHVTAVDLSPTAITKAIKETPSELSVRFLVGDVTDGTSLRLPDEYYDLAMDIGCLHMMANNEDRSNYLTFAYKILRHGGRFFVQNGLDLNDVNPTSTEEMKQIDETRDLMNKPARFPSSRKILTAAGEQEITVPLCPTCKFPGLNDYIQEITSYGFRIFSSERGKGVNCAYEAIILAVKP